MKKDGDNVVAYRAGLYSRVFSLAIVRFSGFVCGEFKFGVARLSGSLQSAYSSVLLSHSGRRVKQQDFGYKYFYFYIKLYYK